jgi:ABC-type multidrug transport system fused ATPase/permease subunit
MAVTKKNLFKGIRRTVYLIWQVDHTFFIITTILTLIGGLLPIAISYSYRLFVDRLVHDTTNHVQTISLVLLYVLALRYILDAIATARAAYLYEYIQRVSRLKTQAWLNYVVSEKISGLDLEHFESPKTQELITKIWSESLGRIIPAVNNVFFALAYGTTLIGSIVALLPYSYLIPAVALAVTLPRLKFRAEKAKFGWSIFNRDVPEARKLSYYSDLLQKKDFVIEGRIFQSQNYWLKKIKFLQHKVLEDSIQPIKGYIRKIWWPILLEVAFIFLVIYLKLPTVLSGALSIGSLVYVVQLLDSIIGSSSDLNSQLTSIYEDQLYIENYFKLMELQPLVKEKDPGHEFEEIKPPKIEFNNVSFKYPNGTHVLKNISFSINPGEHLAIVGPNGAGKTTLIKLFLRLYDPSGGTIEINNFDLKDIKRSNWYRFVSTLFQSFQKYHLTVKENITMGGQVPADEDKMQEAAEMSGAIDFIEKFPKKYEEQLGREFDGEELSQGQWQKLALARAFYEEAPILILDEPTSAIDAEAEAEIFENLNNVYKNKTVIFISHRFSTVRNADKIIVLENGRISEEGTHQSLMTKNGTYARMFKKQAKGYID